MLEIKRWELENTCFWNNMMWIRLEDDTSENAGYIHEQSEWMCPEQEQRGLSAWKAVPPLLKGSLFLLKGSAFQARLSRCYFPGTRPLRSRVPGFWGIAFQAITYFLERILIRNFYLLLVSRQDLKAFGLKPTRRIKAFIFRFVTVPAKWVRTARQDVLNIYSENNAYAWLFYRWFLLMPFIVGWQHLRPLLLCRVRVRNTLFLRYHAHFENVCTQIL